MVITKMKKQLIKEFITPEEQRRRRKNMIIMMSTTALLLTIMIVNPAFATEGDATATIKGVVKNMIKIIELVFQVIGVVMSAFSAGQLVLAIKNEDADSKARASTQLVVGLVLIGIPTLINALKLDEQITVTIG